MGLVPATLEELTQTITQDVPFSVALVWMSLHSDDPGSSGANEITFGTGASGRQAVPFTDTNTSDVSYTVGEAVTVTYIGFWTAQTAGTFLGGFPMVGTMQLVTGIFGATDWWAPSHGFAVGDNVRLFDPPGFVATIPAPYTADTPYVVNAVDSVDQFTIVQSGGFTQTFTASGSCAIAPDLSVTTPAQGGLVIFPANTGVVYSTVS